MSQMMERRQMMQMILRLPPAREAARMADLTNLQIVQELTYLAECALTYLFCCEMLTIKYIQSSDMR